MLKIENGKVIIELDRLDLQPLVDANIITKEQMNTAESVKWKGVVFKVGIDNIINSLSFSPFVTDFRNLFPEGYSKQYGKRFRGVLGQVEKNLKKFKKEFKYTDGEILQATQNMIERQVSLGKREWIPQAHFFIYHKDRGSELAEECENILTNEKKETKWK